MSQLNFKFFKIYLFFQLILPPLFIFGLTETPAYTTRAEPVLEIINKFQELNNTISLEFIEDGSITESNLKYQRIKLTKALVEIKKFTIIYTEKLEKSRAVVNDFAVSDKGKKIDENFKVTYDEFYLASLKKYRQRISFYKGILLRLRLLKEKTMSSLKEIEKMRRKIYDGDMWVSSEPFYYPHAWVSAYNEFKEYNDKLLENIISLYDIFLDQIKTIKFWIILIGLLLATFVYYKSIRPRGSSLINKISLEGNYIDSLSKKSFVLLIYILVRGLIPVLLLFLTKSFILNTLGLITSPLLVPFINSLFNSLAFIVIMLSLIFVFLNQNLNFVKFKNANYFQKHIIAVIIQIGIIFFINNVDFFSTNAPPAAFYPNQATALINLMLSITLMITFYRLCYGKKNKLQEKEDV